ncbi:MAG: phosphoglucomutase (alpha-D-glucose-1,6-bisphosphate-dependent) [Deinococcales bacterium]
MSPHPNAGEPAPRDLLVDVPKLIASYYTLHPDVAVAEERVAFGTSGHRGTSFGASFNEDHILAVSQAVCEYRSRQGVDGPLVLGADTHGLSEPAMRTAIEVLVANGVHVIAAMDFQPVPTPVVSHAILTLNADADAARADGVVITPSHNPPSDGGFKYNPPHGGPAGTGATGWIQDRANALLESGLEGVKRVAYARATPLVQARDLVGPYVEDLGTVLDLDAVRHSGVRIGVDPLGGASLAYWEPIADRWGLDLTLVDAVIDPTFAFMRVDHDGKIRMDCSSPHAMAGLIALRSDFDVAFGNDPDADRHGIVTPSRGLLNPNHYLSVAVDYLFRHRPDWPPDAAVGKTLVSSSMIDRVAADLGRPLAEVPVGFKYFVDALLSGRYGFGGEESAGASFLRRDGTVWTTDKDGLLLGLLAAEITAVTGSDPGELYRGLTERFGEPCYARSDAPATAAQKRVLAAMSPQSVTTGSLAGDPIRARLTTAPATGDPIGGLKVVSDGGWFAARPSGTEDVYKIYAESFRGEEHLERLQQEARWIVQAAFEAAGA